MTSNYKIMDSEKIAECFTSCKENLNNNLYNLIINWIDNKEWILAVQDSSRYFLELPTRQKSLLLIFSEALGLYFNPEDEQTIWKSYGQIQRYFTTEIQSKYRSTLRNLLYKFYQYVLNSYKEYNQTNHLKDILIKSELAQGNNTLAKSFNYLSTNFPADSLYYQVFSIECRAKSKVNKLYVYHSNIYVNTTSKIIINIIKEHIKEMEKHDIYTKYNTPYYRTLFYHFGKSISKNIQSTTDFDRETFLEQYNYYKKLDQDGKIPSKHRKSIIADLTRIYRYIDNTHLKTHGELLFDSPVFNSHFMKSNIFKKSVEERYTPLVINVYDKLPETDRWIVIPPLDNRSYNSNIYRALSFDEVENQTLRKLLKSHVWNSSTRDPIDRFSHLVNFLNDMDNNLSRQLQTGNDMFFEHDFLSYYYMELCIRTDIGDQMINSVIFSIRNFLRHVQEIYNIPEYIVSMYKELPRNNYQAGNPINEEDLLEINKSFLNSTSVYKDELYIVFKLSLMTKLRPGEILSLERDCIVSKNNQHGTIRYYSKINKEDRTYATFTIDIIREIEKAIELTTPAFKMARDLEKKYIFIGKLLRRGVAATDYKVIRLIPTYGRLFFNIVKDLYDSKKISKWYTPYSCRDTHINNAFELIEDGKISLHEVSTITGNTANIARKHYLSKDRRTRKYLENMFEVKLLDQQVQGSVEEGQSEHNNYPIQNNMGDCNSKKCVKQDDMEDSSYKCLTCKHFITSLEKMSMFEERVKDLKVLVEKSNNHIEKNFYKHSLELNLRYLGEMYAMKGLLNDK